MKISTSVTLVIIAFLNLMVESQGNNMFGRGGGVEGGPSGTSPPTLDGVKTELNGVKTELKEGILARNKGNALEGKGIPLAVRLAFHDCVGPHGCDGCVNLKNPANDGLRLIIQKLTALRNRKFKDISNADMWQIAGITAIEMAGGPTLDFVEGRPDCETSPSTSEEHEFPSPKMNRIQMMNWFRRHPHGFNMNEHEVTALMGAHALGGAKLENSGYHGTWTPGEETVFNGEYYKRLFEGPWHFRNHQLSNGKWQFETARRKPGSESFMLNTDIELAFNVTLDEKSKATCIACRRRGQGQPLDFLATCEQFNHTYTSFTDKKYPPACDVAASTSRQIERYALEFVFAKTNSAFFGDFKQVYEKMMTAKINQELLSEPR